MYLQQFFVEGLGHASYLIGSGRINEAAVVDPRRDVQVYVDAAHRAGLKNGTSLLKQLGFRDAWNVLGGMTAWREAGYPNG